MIDPKFYKEIPTNLKLSYISIKGVIGEVRCGFLRIYAPTSYSAIFLLHALTPAPIKISFGAVQFGLVRCGVGAVLRFGLNSFRSD